MHGSRQRLKKTTKKVWTDTLTMLPRAAKIRVRAAAAHSPLALVPYRRLPLYPLIPNDALDPRFKHNLTQFKADPPLVTRMVSRREDIAYPAMVSKLRRPCLLVVVGGSRTEAHRRRLPKTIRI